MKEELEAILKYRIKQEAFNLRHEGDYGEHDLITKEETLNIMKGAARFLKTIKEHVW